jgi:hypothetical protein
MGLGPRQHQRAEQGTSLMSVNTAPAAGSPAGYVADRIRRPPRRGRDRVEPLGIEYPAPRSVGPCPPGWRADSVDVVFLGLAERRAARGNTDCRGVTRTVRPITRAANRVGTPFHGCRELLLSSSTATGQPPLPIPEEPRRIMLRMLSQQPVVYSPVRLGNTVSAGWANSRSQTR